jgi:hypothetical protein
MEMMVDELAICMSPKLKMLVSFISCRGLYPLGEYMTFSFFELEEEEAVAAPPCFCSWLRH